MFLKARPTFHILNFDWWSLKLLQVTDSFFQKCESKAVLIYDVTRMHLGMTRGQEQAPSAGTSKVILKARSSHSRVVRAAICPLWRHWDLSQGDNTRWEGPTAPWRRLRALHRPPRPPRTNHPKMAQNRKHREEGHWNGIVSLLPKFSFGHEVKSVL